MSIIVLMLLSLIVICLSQSHYNILICVLYLNLFSISTQMGNKKTKANQIKSKQYIFQYNYCDFDRESGHQTKNSLNKCQCSLWDITLQWVIYKMIKKSIISVKSDLIMSIIVLMLLSQIVICLSQSHFNILICVLYLNLFSISTLNQTR